MFRITLVFAMSLLESVEAYISQYKWNQDLMQSLVDDYEIVYPFQVRDRSRIGIDTKNYFFTNVTIHFEQATFVVKSSYGRFKINVELNKLLVPSGASFKYFFNDTSQATLRGNEIENCFYQGTVHNEENSRVAISTCNGLQGSLLIHNQTYFIVPMKGGDLGKRHPHIFVRAKWHQKINCGNSGLTEWNHQLERKQSFLKRQNKRDVSTETKYIELALIIDQAANRQLDSEYKMQLSFFLDVVNGADLIFMDSFNTRLSVVYFESYVNRNERFIDNNDDITQTLLNFMEFSSKYLYSQTKDVSILISGTKFIRNEVTMSASGNVCSAKSAGVVQLLNRFEPFRLSATMSHNIAHIIGVRHDDSGKSSDSSSSVCECSDKSGCLMNRAISGRRNRFSKDFSTCSSSDYRNILASGQANCLFNKPLEEDSLRLCGNKIVDPGERCDCGSIEECDSIDPCCDAVTCTLKKGAECGAGPCCDSCKLVKDGRVCRSTDDDCDVPEFCSGISGQCPADAHKLDGTTCGQISDGYCYFGRCQTSAKQCQALWGPEADAADSHCFDKLNVATFETGVSTSHSMCSFLQCKGGTETSKLPIYSKTEFAEHGRSFECKTASNGNKSATENEGLVKDGTKCGLNKICIDRACVHLASITTDSNCPSNHGALQCSGHGVCTNLNLCYCNNGWIGADCGMKVEIQQPHLVSTTYVPTSIHSLKHPYLFDPRTNDSVHPEDNFFGSPISFSSRLDTYAMLIILSGVAGGVLILLLFLALCYRRRTSSIMHKKKLMVFSSQKDFERCSESSMDTAHRSIRFGEMPSYRDEKVQSKQRKKQRSLHQIKENEEKDSVSNKSKESAHSAVSCEETESMLFAVIQQQNDLSSRYPERGILKNGPMRVNSELESYALCENRLIGPPPSSSKMPMTNDGGYESEPAYPTFRVFENSMRKLNDCDPYRRRTSQNDDQETYVSYAGSAASAPISRRPLTTTLSAGAYAKNAGFRSGYSTDEDKTCRGLQQRRFIDDSSPDMPTPSPSMSQRAVVDRMAVNRGEKVSSGGSPTSSEKSTSAAGGSVSARLTEAQPLQLKNIEYLLKQLDRKSNTSVSPSSSTEFSVPEADKDADDAMLEESSNTESHRDMQYAVRRDFPNDFVAIPTLMSSSNATNLWRTSPPVSSAVSGSVAMGEKEIASPMLSRLNLINYSQSNICASCQLPTPDQCCGGGGDGRISSDGSCDNNVCACKTQNQARNF